MRKLTFATIVLALFSIPALAQNFEPAPSDFQQKLENGLKREGTVERAYLTNTKQKTFDAKPGKEYYTWVVFKKSSTSVRRIMIYQLGQQGEKVKIHYPKFNQAITDAENQAFLISITVPEDTNTPSVTYKVDVSADASVYIYQLTRGFKRDLHTKD